MDLKGRGSSLGRGLQTRGAEGRPPPQEAELQLQEGHFNPKKSRWSMACEPPCWGEGPLGVPGQRHWSW